MQKEALNTQVGGNHYKSMAYQPVEFSHDLRITFIQGSIVKYVSRYKNKNGLQDLEKAKHFARLAIDLNHFGSRTTNERTVGCLKRFCNDNNLSDKQIDAIIYVLDCDWFNTIIAVDAIIKDYSSSVNGQKDKQTFVNCLKYIWKKFFNRK